MEVVRQGNESIRNKWKRQRRQVAGHGKDEVGAGRSTVPRGSSVPTVASQQLRVAFRCWNTGLLGHCARVPGCRDAGVGGHMARDKEKARIIPRHLQVDIRNDEEVNKLLGGVTIAQGDVVTNIQAVLLPQKTRSRWVARGTQCKSILADK
uniref:Histone H2A n=1 Tax=Taenia asiatica TaxID=60517 RepID=A0A0R3WHD6_TAEAS